MEAVALVRLALAVITDRLITILALLASSVMWLDNVESDVGESGDTSHIRSIQLSCSQYQRKEQK